MIDSGDVKAPYPQYRCPVDGEDLPLTEARITVTCERHRPHDAPTDFTVREATHADRQAIELICDRVWGETELDSFGRTFDVMAGENLIAEIDEDQYTMLDRVAGRHIDFVHIDFRYDEVKRLPAIKHLLGG